MVSSHWSLAKIAMPTLASSRALSANCSAFFLEKEGSLSASQHRHENQSRGSHARPDHSRNRESTEAKYSRNGPAMWPSPQASSCTVARLARDTLRTGNTRSIKARVANGGAPAMTPQRPANCERTYRCNFRLETRTLADKGVIFGYRVSLDRPRRREAAGRHKT